MKMVDGDVGWGRAAQGQHECVLHESAGLTKCVRVVKSFQFHLTVQHFYEDQCVQATK